MEPLRRVACKCYRMSCVPSCGMPARCARPPGTVRNVCACWKTTTAGPAWHETAGERSNRTLFRATSGRNSSGQEEDDEPGKRTGPGLVEVRWPGAAVPAGAGSGTACPRRGQEPGVPPSLPSASDRPATSAFTDPLSRKLRANQRKRNRPGISRGGSLSGPAALRAARPRPGTAPRGPGKSPPAR